MATESATQAASAEAKFDLTAARLGPDTVAVVTGAAQGLGKEFARGLLEKGAKVIVTATTNPDRPEKNLFNATLLFTHF